MRLQTHLTAPGDGSMRSWPEDAPRYRLRITDGKQTETTRSDNLEALRQYAAARLKERGYLWAVLSGR